MSGPSAWTPTPSRSTASSCSFHPQDRRGPISVSAQGDGWLEFTIRSVGKVTNVIFQKEAGDTLFLRGPYGKGWPVEQFQGKHLVVITGGTGLAPSAPC